MSLAKGARLGVYEIFEPVGAGGMGEVYRARDTKLGRDVALKILPDLFASDPDRLSRFEREAQVLAALNHPHIAAIYGFEESPSTSSAQAATRALVLEFVDGPTLADRIAHGPLALDEALTISLQLVDALEAAHAQGIIHRDLKPANIKLRADGNLKVLDFGLAKAFDPRTSPDTTAGGPSISPTMTAATQLGLILGTAAYMSPEQARGKQVDKRTDIWAFGCVLYEMLTGQRAFPGGEITDVIAYVITKEPDWSALPAMTPTALRRVLHRCLEKDRKQRLADIADARLELEEARTAPVEREVVVAQHGGRWPVALAWSVAAIALAALIVVLAPWRAKAPGSVARLTTDIGADASLVVDQGAAFAISPDGQVVVFAAQGLSSPDTQLYVRRLDQLQAVVLAGTTGARNPFFSPDGQWVGFFADGKLKKISIAGGALVTLCDAPRGRGGTWSSDGTIIFTPQGAGRVALLQVSDAGGKPAEVAPSMPGELVQRFPQILPGGKAVLYTVNTAVGSGQTSKVFVQPLPSGARRLVHDGGFYGRYLPSGHVAYIRDATLFAIPFDLGTLTVTGQPMPILEGVAANASTGGAQFAVSDSGTLIYVPGSTVSSSEAPISWLDRSGKVTTLRAAVSDWSNPQFSPDGNKLAFDIAASGNTDVWIYDWARDRMFRLTNHPADDVKPVWTPDGSRIVFASRRDMKTGDSIGLNMYWQRADGTGEATRLLESPLPQEPSSWHLSGKFLAFTQFDGANRDAMILPVDGDERSGWTIGKPTPFANAPESMETEPMFSPDGRWIAYFSNESGTSQIFVRPFPGPGGKFLVSNGPGQDPAWSRTRQELFYWTGAQAGADGQLFVAPFQVKGDEFIAERPELVTAARIALRARQRDFGVHPDGSRFAVAVFQQPDATEKRDKVVMVFNFADELRRLAK